MKRKIDEVKSIRILKARNGVALIAVLAILLILTLLLPAMFSMGEIQMKDAIKGMDTQRASYLARAITEMSVAAFKQSYTEITAAKDGGYFPTTEEDINSATDRMKFLATKVSPVFDELYDGKRKQLTTETVYMFYKETDKQFYFAAAGSDDYTAYSTADSGYRLVGNGSCTITFDGKISYYKVDSVTQIPEKLEDDINEETGAVIKTAEEKYKEYKGKIEAAINSGNPDTAGKIDYTVSQVQNRNIIFSADGIVNGKRQTRKCIVVLPTYPSEKQWLYFDGKAGPTDSTTGIQKITKGCNQMNFDPAGATGLAVINYTETGIDDYTPQPLQIFSCLGNMIINARDVKDAIYDDDGKRIDDEKRQAVKNGVNGSELVLGVVPSLNTVGNDPNWNIIRGINGYASKSGIQKDNFIACSASNAIEVDVPINLMVNGLRTLRRGDWALGSMWPGEGHEENVSIYKILMFQAPIIYFARNVDMMASFYTAPATRNDKARRMSSVILMAPASTPYHYYNEERGTTVKAGKVFFGEDCYVWIINHGNNGSDYSEHWYEFNQTVWKKDSDFVKVKVASAGDVYYFNSEVKMTDTVKTGLFGRTTVTTERNAGFSITGYAVEVLYVKNFQTLTKGAWWDVWTNTKEALFGFYMQNINKENDTYVKDDLKYLGNIYTDSEIEVPEIDNFYTVWES